MKKLIGTAMLAALLATSAFAELSMSAWICQLWSPIAYNGGDVKTGSQNPWGDGRTGNVGFNWVSEDEKAGTSFAIVYDPWSGKIEGDGSRVIWAKPWDFLKVSLGHWDNYGDTDVSAIGTASWDWIRPGNWNSDVLYRENEDTGAIFQITPMDDLYIAVGLPFANADESYHMFEALRADVAYTVPDIVKIMVGWRGGRAIANKSKSLTKIYIESEGDDDDNFITYEETSTIANGFGETHYKVDGKLVNVGEISVLARLLAVESLSLDVGARINIYDSAYYGTGSKTRGEDIEKAFIGLKAGYSITDAIAINADFAVQLKEVQDPSFQFGVGVGVGFTDSLSLVADFRGQIQGDLKVEGETTTYDPTFSFLVGLNYACSTNANVGIGFQGKTNGGVIGPLDKRKDYDGFGFAVPIRVNVSF